MTILFDSTRARKVRSFGRGLVAPSLSDRAWWASQTSPTPIRSTDRLISRAVTPDAEWDRHIDAIYAEVAEAEACFGCWW